MTMARLHGRDVEREAQGVAHPHGPALEVVRVGRRVAAAEVGDDVHEHRRRRDALVRDARGVDDRLERRARLAPAVGEDVEPGLELLRRLLGVRVGRPDVGDEVARLVVHRHERAVVEVLGCAGCPSSARTGGRAPCAVARGFFELGTIVAALTHFSAIVLEAHVEGRRDGEAAGLDDGCTSRCRRRTASSSAPRGPATRTAGAFHWLDRCGGEDHRRRLAPPRSRRRVNVPLVSGVRPLLHQVEDQVPAQDDRASVRDDELRLLARLGVGRLGARDRGTRRSRSGRGRRSTGTWAGPR